MTRRTTSPEPSAPPQRHTAPHTDPHSTDPYSIDHDPGLPENGAEIAADKAPAQPAHPLSPATGTDDPDLAEALLREAAQALWLPESLGAAAQESRLRAALAALSSIAPRDAMEGMLAAQMVATHGAAMECLGRAMLPGQAEPDREINLRHAAKLLSLYGRQMDTLNRHRGRGQQTVTVQHVQVEPGGQAIVGAIQTGGGRKGARSRGDDGE